jgi:hypothetical protein
VTLVSDEPTPNAERVGGAVAARISGWLEDDGVELALGTAVERSSATATACGCMPARCAPRARWS